MIVVISNSDNMIRLIGLVDKSVAPGADPIDVGSATVTGVIKDQSAATIVTLPGLTQIGSSNDYESLLSDVESLLMDLERDYVLSVTADDGDNRKRVFVDTIRSISG